MARTTNTGDFADEYLANTSTSVDYVDPEDGTTKTATTDIRPQVETLCRTISEQVPVSWQKVSADTTLSDPVNQVVLVDTAAGPVTITLPPTADCEGKTITIKKVTSDTNALHVYAASGNLDGAGFTSTTAAFGFIRVFSDGTTFWKL